MMWLTQNVDVVTIMEVWLSIRDIYNCAVYTFWQGSDLMKEIVMLSLVQHLA